MIIRSSILFLSIIFLAACTPIARWIDPCSEINESEFIEDTKRIDGYYPDPPNDENIIIFDGNTIAKSPPENILARVESIKIKSPLPSIKDILDQITISAPAYRLSECNAIFDPNQPTLSRPILRTLENQIIEPLDRFQARVCGWTEPVLLSVTLMYPDRSEKKSLVETNSEFASSQTLETVYGTDISFQPTLDSLYGEYKFKVEDGFNTLEANFSVVSPDGPRIRRWYNGNWRTLLLYNFNQEEVRVFEYNRMTDDSYCFVGWQSYQTDSQGRLEIYLNNLTRFERFVAIGSSSGEVSEIDPSILKTSP